MEKAFWDGVMESLENNKSDYSRIVGLVSEVKVELCELAPRLWKQEIHDSIDIEILTQVYIYLESLHMGERKNMCMGSEPVIRYCA